MKPSITAFLAYRGRAATHETVRQLQASRLVRKIFLLAGDTGVEPKFVLGVTSSWALQLGLAAYWVAVHPRFHWEIDGAGDGQLETRAFALLLRIGVIDFLR